MTVCCCQILLHDRAPSLSACQSRNRRFLGTRTIDWTCSNCIPGLLFSARCTIWRRLCPGLVFSDHCTIWRRCQQSNQVQPVCCKWSNQLKYFAYERRLKKHAEFCTQVFLIKWSVLITYPSPDSSTPFQNILLCQSPQCRYICSLINDKRYQNTIWFKQTK